MTQLDRPVSLSTLRKQKQLATTGDSPVPLAQVIDTLLAPVAVWDSDMRNSWANVAYASWFGMTPAQLYGVHVADLVDEQTYQRNLPSLRRVLSGLPETYETRLRDVSGALRDVQVTLTPIITDDTVTGFSVLFVDLTARVYAEAELRAHREKAAACRERSRIAAQLHEVALQELYAASLSLTMAVRGVPDEIEPRIEFAIAAIDHAIVEVRAKVRVEADDEDGHER